MAYNKSIVSPMDCIAQQSEYLYEKAYFLDFGCFVFLHDMHLLFERCHFQKANQIRDKSGTRFEKPFFFSCSHI